MRSKTPSTSLLRCIDSTGQTEPGLYDRCCHKCFAESTTFKPILPTRQTSNVCFGGMLMIIFNFTEHGSKEERLFWNRLVNKWATATTSDMEALIHSECCTETRVRNFSVLVQILNIHTSSSDLFFPLGDKNSSTSWPGLKRWGSPVIFQFNFKFKQGNLRLKPRARLDLSTPYPLTYFQCSTSCIMIRKSQDRDDPG